MSIAHVPLVVLPLNKPPKENGITCALPIVTSPAGLQDFSRETEAIEVM